jgi:hypothetical protein
VLPAPAREARGESLSTPGRRRPRFSRERPPCSSRGPPSRSTCRRVSTGIGPPFERGTRRRVQSTSRSPVSAISEKTR